MFRVQVFSRYMTLNTVNNSSNDIYIVQCPIPIQVHQEKIFYSRHAHININGRGSCSYKDLPSLSLHSYYDPAPNKITPGF